MWSKKISLAQLTLLVSLYCPRWLFAQNLFTAVSNTAFSSSIDDVDRNTSSTGGLIQPSVIPVKRPFRVRPFSTIALGLRVNSLGPGIDLATPLSHSFNLRAGFNLFNFGYNFNIDGVNYYSGVHLRSGQLTLDWFPRHRGFRISPGIIYVRNNLSAVTGVPAGHIFNLASESFINSVDDPMSGTAAVVLPRKLAPSLTVGFGNMIPRSGRHLSFPMEFGVAYTGAPKIDVTLDGTACIRQGCFAFSQNPEAEASLRQEIHDLNEDLKRVPVFPVVSVGMAYRF